MLGLGGEKEKDTPFSMMELGGKAENGEVLHQGEVEGASANESPVVGLLFGRK